MLSFLIIARFWVSHERLFDYVERWTGWLMILNVLWMLTIVFLPVVTAMVGSMDTDRLQIALYIGTMLVNTLVMTAMVWWCCASGDWGDEPAPPEGLPPRSRWRR